MNFNIKNRFLIFGLVLVGLFAVLFVQLIKLTVVQGAAFAAQASKLDKETITISGARGSILDRNGLPLAYDVRSYNVQFYKDPTQKTDADRAYYTDIITKTIKLIEDNGGKTIDTFAIKYDSDKGYYFDWGDIKPKDAINREKNWRANMYVGTTRTPEQIYLYLRGYYQIPNEVDYNEARKILSVWQEVQLASWAAYNPIVVAYNVNTQTVAEVETDSNVLTGMSIAESTTRIYPRGDLAAHVIGYLGKVTDPDQLKVLQAKGYNVDDFVGVAGIEDTMEDYLTGNSADRQGTEQVEVDNYKVVKNVVSSTQPKQGDNVELTIDIPLQQAVEAALAKEIPKIKNDELNQFNTHINSKEYAGLDVNKLKLATSGAAVVLDIKTGEVLAMASYPSFDPNLFIQGMTKDEYDAFGFNDKDTAPLMNKAVSSKDTPGSIFKLVTGLGALMQGNTQTGTTLDERIYCQYYYTDNTLATWTGKKSHDWDRDLISKPQWYDIKGGIENSCDYYFFTLSSRLGIDLIDQWGEKFGLTSSTGIELPGEAIGFIGNQQILYDGTKPIDKQATYLPQLVKSGQKYGLINMLKTFALQRKISYTDSVYSKTADDLIALAGLGFKTTPTDNVFRDTSGKSIGDYVRDVLSKDMQIRSSVARAFTWDTQIAQLITSNLIWTPYMTIQTGIGQGVVQVTPIAVARYIAAIANGGTVYETHIVKKIVDQNGQTVFEQKPVVYDTLDAPSQYIDAIRQGMADVVSGEDGTAKDVFKNFVYKKKIAGKTGTAQVSNTDLEDNGWFVCFAPYDPDDSAVKPEIAIVVYIPHGYKGANGGWVARDILQFYLDREKIKSVQEIPSSNSLVK